MPSRGKSKIICGANCELRLYGVCTTCLETPMARTKKIEVVVRSSRDEADWIAEAQDGSNLLAEHYMPDVALRVLAERLRAYHGTNVELTHDVLLPSALRRDADELLEAEDLLQDLTRQVPEKRMKIAEKLARRHLQNRDMAKILRISEGYMASIVKRAARSRGPKTGR